MITLTLTEDEALSLLVAVRTERERVESYSLGAGLHVNRGAGHHARLEALGERLAEGIIGPPPGPVFDGENL
jgi:hypothetical protein